jgi:hypothetical protein
MGLRASKGARKDSTLRLECMRLEDRVVPGEVLGTAMRWALGALAYPALAAADNPSGDAGQADGAGRDAAADIGRDDPSAPLALIPVEDPGTAPPPVSGTGSSSNVLDASAAGVSTDTAGPAFGWRGPTLDLGGTLDTLTAPALASGARGAAAMTAAAVASLSGPAPSLPGGDVPASLGHAPAAPAVSVQPRQAGPGAADPAACLPATAPPSLTHPLAAPIPAAPATLADGGGSALDPVPAASADAAWAADDSGGPVAVPLMVAHPASAPGGASPFGPNGSAPFSPAQIQHAYGFDQLSNHGAGQTIFIVDAYNDPNITRDLQTFDAQWGLPNSPLTVHKMSSRVGNNVSWGIEESLDVEWAHAMAPQANIVLVEATSASYSALFSAVNWATTNGAHVVSMSWGGGDYSGEASYDSYFKHSGVSYVASAGDSGGVVEYPSASPYVLSVGGTSLTLDANNNYVSESAWSSGGGGASVGEAEPGFQANYGIGLGGRGTPDVAYNGDPNTGYFVYDSYTYQPGWYAVGGTSAGAPQWAALIALANQSRGTPLTTYNLTSRTEYNAATGTAYASNYHDVTSESNGYAAGPGYDLATGVGSPQANNLVPWLINNN